MLIDMPLAEMKTYLGSSPLPKDFDRYWAESLAELDATPPELELTPAKEQTRLVFTLGSCAASAEALTGSLLRASFCRIASRRAVAFMAAPPFSGPAPAGCRSCRAARR